MWAVCDFTYLDLDMNGMFNETSNAGQVQ